MNRIKLSIAIPTLNRAQYLQFTLKHFIPQIKPVKEFAELVTVWEPWLSPVWPLPFR